MDQPAKPRSIYRPRWDWIAVLLAIGALVMGVGITVNSFLFALAGLPLILAAQIVLWVPIVRISTRRPGSRSGYSQMSYLGGTMSVLGFGPSEQDAARREAKLIRNEDPE